MQHITCDTLQPSVPLLDSNLNCDSSNPPLQSQERSITTAEAHDEAKDNHLTTTMEDTFLTGDVPGDHEHPSNSNPHEIPPPTILKRPSSVDVPQPPSPPARPHCDCCPPKCYDVETGKCIARWVHQPSETVAFRTGGHSGIRTLDLILMCNTIVYLASIRMYWCSISIYFFVVLCFERLVPRILPNKNSTMFL